ncbi:hypothetical protein DPMN_083603 [Dreissena polymorpha]|uniref:Uncharacterized protein n=1 Tax=Dreissena polymorpha TaxID=45954 RepID=A0A9D3Y9M2_DREPO|nr:hypothetical protein DPMN_083603 [Dreissena polymorpha]
MEYLQGVQVMPKTAETVVKTIEGGLASRRCTCGVAASRRPSSSQRRRFPRILDSSGQYHCECGGQDLHVSGCQAVLQHS